MYYQGYSECSNEDLKKAVSDLQSELVGKIIWQCPQCQTHQCPGTQPVNHKTAAVRAPPPEPVVQGDDGQANHNMVKYNKMLIKFLEKNQRLMLPDLYASSTFRVALGMASRAGVV